MKGKGLKAMNLGGRKKRKKRKKKRKLIDDEVYDLYSKRLEELRG